MSKGLFITFEGPEGSGKSTHSRRVYQDLLSDGYEAAHTLEPGGTELGARIRDILLQKADIRLDRQAELFLFEADRAQHVVEYILPALDEGKIVLCDRYNTATYAYQGYGLGMDLDLVGHIDRVATGGLSPDLTILFDIDVETGLRRAGGAEKADRMEKRSVDFHEKVRNGYLDMAEKDPEKFRIIEVREDIERTYSLVRKEIYGFIAGYKRAGERG